MRFDNFALKIDRNTLEAYKNYEIDQLKRDYELIKDIALDLKLLTSDQLYL